jgi:hypothetical protein
LYYKRVLAGAAIAGAVGLPISYLGAGIASAQPDSAPSANAPGEPLPATKDQPHEQERKANTAATPSGDIADQIARGLSELPPPDLSSLAPQVTVPVSVGVGLPGVGLGLVPNLSVPIVLGGLAAPSLPSLGGLPPLPDLSKLPPPPQLPGIGVPQLPGIGLPSF